MSNTRDTGFLRNAVQVTNQGIVFVSGSTTLMSISSSGAVTTTGVISGSNALSASFSLNSALLNGTGSVGFTTTASFLAVSSSQQQISSSQQQISASLLNVVANYATTGSNSFRADQSITGSLVVSSTITAQTLVVQTVTSSIVYSSGSNLFGSALGDRQTFTGSVNITGSLTVNTTGTEFQVNNNGVILGNLLTDNHSITGSLRVTGSNAIFAGSVGIGNTNPTVKLQVTMNIGGGYPALGVGNSGSLFIAGDTNQYGLYVGNDGVSGNAWLQSMRNNTATAYSIILNPVGGNVGIGTTSPNALLDTYTSQGGSTIAATHGTGGTYPKASGISFGATSTGLSVSNNGSTTTFTGGAGIYASNGAASNNPTDLVFWTTSAGSPTVRLTIASSGAATFAGSATFGSDVFTYANGGIFFNGGGSYGSGIFQQSGGTLALQTGTTPRLTIASTGAATFASSVTATTLALGSVAPSSNGIYLNVPSANGANYGYIRTNALTVNTTQLILGSTYGYNTPVDALTIYNGAASFAGSIGAASAGISSTSITTTASTTLSSSRGIIVDAATTTNNAFIPIGFSWASSISNYNPTWGMGLKTINYNAGTADLVFYTNDTVRMTINNGGAVTLNGNITANNIRTFGVTLQGTGTPVSTGLGINAGGGGRTYLLLTSQQWDAGNSTSGAITMIRCGYDGNNFTAVVLGSSNAQPETWSQSGGILYVAGNTNFQLNITVLNNN
jgi:hypothetical protein